MEDFIGSLLLSTTLFPRKDAQGTKVLLLKPLVVRPEKASARTLGSRFFFDGVDAVLDVGLDVPRHRSQLLAILRKTKKANSHDPRIWERGLRVIAGTPGILCTALACYAFLLASSSASGRLSLPWMRTIQMVLTELMRAAMSR